MAQLTAPVQVSDHVYILYSEFPHADSGNVYLITGEHPTLVDCGSERVAPILVDHLAVLGLDVSDIEQVIATHGDYDHVQGFHGLRRLNPDLRLHIHRDDLRIVQGENAYQTASYVYGRPFLRLDAQHCIPLDAGDVIPVGNSTVTVHHAPGHTEGSICLLGDFDGRSILFAGDAVGGAMRSLDGASLEIWAQAVKTWQRSLRHLADLEFDWVLNGHEPATTLPIERRRFDKLAAHFGKMMNPWFSLDELDPVPTGTLTRQAR